MFDDKNHKNNKMHTPFYQIQRKNYNSNDIRKVHHTCIEHVKIKQCKIGQNVMMLCEICDMHRTLRLYVSVTAALALGVRHVRLVPR